MIKEYGKRSLKVANDNFNSDVTMGLVDPKDFDTRFFHENWG
jgi:hypothetical protein